MSIEQNIQQWVSLDNQIKLYNEKISELREKKGNITEKIIEHASNNNLPKSVFQIGDDKLKIAETKVPETLTFKYLEKSLNEIITNKEQVGKIIDYIKKNRETRVVSEIKRYSNN
jgi:hypothetical protein